MAPRARPGCRKGKATLPIILGYYAFLGRDADVDVYEVLVGKYQGFYKLFPFPLSTGEVCGGALRRYMASGVVVPRKKVTFSFYVSYDRKCLSETCQHSPNDTLIRANVCVQSDSRNLMAGLCSSIFK